MPASICDLCACACVSGDLLCADANSATSEWVSEQCLCCLSNWNWLLRPSVWYYFLACGSPGAPFPIAHADFIFSHLIM